MRFTNLELHQRWFRVGVGLGLMILGWWWSGDEAQAGTLALRVVALYPLLTGVLGWCPVRSLLSEMNRSGEE